MEQPMNMSTIANLPTNGSGLDCGWSKLTPKQILDSVNDAYWEVMSQEVKADTIDWLLTGFQAYYDLRDKDADVIQEAFFTIKKILEKHNAMGDWQRFVNGWKFAQVWHPNRGMA